VLDVSGPPEPPSTQNPPESRGEIELSPAPREPPDPGKVASSGAQTPPWGRPNSGQGPWGRVGEPKGGENRGDFLVLECSDLKCRGEGALPWDKMLVPGGEGGKKTEKLDLVG